MILTVLGTGFLAFFLLLLFSLAKISKRSDERSSTHLEELKQRNDKTTST